MSMTNNRSFIKVGEWEVFYFNFFSRHIFAIRRHQCHQHRQHIATHPPNNKNQPGTSQTDAHRFANNIKSKTKHKATLGLSKTNHETNTHIATTLWKFQNAFKNMHTPPQHTAPQARNMNIITSPSHQQLESTPKGIMSPPRLNTKLVDLGVCVSAQG